MGDVGPKTPRHPQHHGVESRRAETDKLALCSTSQTSCHSHPCGTSECQEGLSHLAESCGETSFSTEQDQLLEDPAYTGPSIWLELAKELRSNVYTKAPLADQPPRPQEKGEQPNPVVGCPPCSRTGRSHPYRESECPTSSRYNPKVYKPKGCSAKPILTRRDPAQTGTPDRTESKVSNGNEWTTPHIRSYYQTMQKSQNANKMAIPATAPGCTTQHPRGQAEVVQLGRLHYENLGGVKPIITSLLTQQKQLFAESEKFLTLLNTFLGLHQKRVEKKRKKKNYDSKVTLLQGIVAILLALAILLPITMALSLESPTVDGPTLFDKDQLMSKLISKNQIAYHFKKVVREVTQELFVSRKLDVSMLFLGVHVLKNTAMDLSKYCQTIGSAPIPSLGVSSTGLSHYLHIGIPKQVSHAEAKARCKAKNMQLPEIYSLAQHEQLSSFLKANKIKRCFAGLEPDILDAIYRFISTGYPIWKSPYTHAQTFGGTKTAIEVLMDDFNGKFMYGDDNLLYFYGVDGIASDPNNKLGDRLYRDKVKQFSQITGSIVCEPVWDGNTLSHLTVNQGPMGSMYLHSYPKDKRSVGDEPPQKGNSDPSALTNEIVNDEADIKGQSDFPIFTNQSVDDEIPKKDNSDSSDFQDRMFNDGTSNKGTPEASIPETLKEYCVSIASQALDVSDEMSVKLKNLLSLVDITVQVESDSRVQRSEPKTSDTELMLYQRHAIMARPKRFAFLASFIFKTGIKMIWGLFGFIDKIMKERRLRKIESNISNVQKQAKDNSNNIQQLSSFIAINSLAIDNLKITTNDLSRRMNNLENRVDSIVLNVADLADNFRDMMRLSLVANLVNRIKQSIDSGYDTLKDIIHCSLLGQTSPLLLPTDQVKLVQEEVRKVSTGLLDTDFAKMQSIIVSDPLDPQMLLVVINVAALSRTELELVKLVPIPQFEKEKSFSPTLDYNTIVVDQLSRKYYILTEQEEYDCLFHRCYISDVERSVDQRTCGIPQLFDQQLDACVFEESLPDTGVFIKPMLPDGIIFAFRDKVQSQLFCEANSKIGPIRSLSGTGIMQLPNGCILSVTDKLGKNTKVKGQPIYRAIIAGDISLIMNGPLTALQTHVSRNDSQKKLTANGILVDHLFPVVQQVNSVDAKVSYQALFIWGLIAVLSLAVIIITLVIYFQYKSHKKFFMKIYDLRERFSDIGRQVLTLRELRNRLRRRPHSPSTHRSIRDVFHLGSSHRFQHHAIDQSEHDEEEGMYVSMDPVDEVASVPVAMGSPSNLSGNKTLLSFRLNRKAEAVPKVPYPDIAQPLLDQLQLEKEGKEVDDLCKQVSKKKEENDYSK